MIAWMRNLLAMHRQAKAYRIAGESARKAQQDFCRRADRRRALPTEIAALEVMIAERASMITRAIEGFPVSLLTEQEDRRAQLVRLKSELAALNREFDPAGAILGDAMRAQMGVKP